MITGGAIPQVKTAPNECVIETNKICVSSDYVKYMRSYLSNIGYDISKLNDAKIVELIKSDLGVDSEAGIWEHKKFKAHVGNTKSNHVINHYYKPQGPSHSTALLNNFNIDAILEQWSVHADKLFGCKFYHMIFQMIDFAKKKTELDIIDLYDLIKNKYDCMGVVLNTDISTGGGKHWFCLFCDFKHTGTEDDPYTLEYFNSSGNSPMTEVEVWLQKTKHNLLKKHNCHAVIVRSASKRLQHSQTECGVWSLMYIKSRLQNFDTKWFYTTKADDNDMILLRKHLFRKKN